MACRISIRVTSPDGSREERPVENVLNDVEAESEPEQWKEVARTIEKVDVEGIEVNRIIKTTFEKPSGKRIELVFAEAQPGVDPDSITTEA